MHNAEFHRNSTTVPLTQFSRDTEFWNSGNARNARTRCTGKIFKPQEFKTIFKNYLAYIFVCHSQLITQKQFFMTDPVISLSSSISNFNNCLATWSQVFIGSLFAVLKEPATALINVSISVSIIKNFCLLWLILFHTFSTKWSIYRIDKILKNQKLKQLIFL